MLRFEIAFGKAYGALSCGTGSRWLNNQVRSPLKYFSFVFVQKLMIMNTKFDRLLLAHTFSKAFRMFPVAKLSLFQVRFRFQLVSQFLSNRDSI